MELLRYAVGPHPSGEESARQRLDRNFNELLQELRVTQTGVQILLAFVLTLAFSTRLATLGLAERVLYAVAVVLTTLAMGLLLGPVALHRFLFQQRLKESIVRLTHLCLTAGLAVLYLAVNAAVLLALWVALGVMTAVVLATVAAVMVGAVWFVTPMILRTRGSQAALPPAGVREQREAVDNN